MCNRQCFQDAASLSLENHSEMPAASKPLDIWQRCTITVLFSGTVAISLQTWQGAVIDTTFGQDNTFRCVANGSADTPCTSRMLAVIRVIMRNKPSSARDASMTAWRLYSLILISRVKSESISVDCRSI